TTTYAPARLYGVTSGPISVPAKIQLFAVEPGSLGANYYADSEPDIRLAAWQQLILTKNLSKRLLKATTLFSLTGGLTGVDPAKCLHRFMMRSPSSTMTLFLAKLIPKTSNNWLQQPVFLQFQP